MSEEKNKFKVGDRIKVNNLYRGIGTIIDINDTLGSSFKNKVKFDDPLYFTCGYGDDELKLNDPEDNLISKDKIREKIKELVNRNVEVLGDYRYYFAIKVLQELLEENNNE